MQTKYLVGMINFKNFTHYGQQASLDEYSDLRTGSFKPFTIMISFLRYQYSSIFLCILYLWGFKGSGHLVIPENNYWLKTFLGDE